MPKRTDIHSVLIIGAGPIIIGQACEFDYSGTQACKALREEGYRVILINSNPATIMTDPEFADRTYIEPITPECVEKIIVREKEEMKSGIGANRRKLVLLPTLGGQTALNTAMALHRSGVLEKHGVEMIGAKAEAIHKGEDRHAFKELMLSIGLDVPISGVAHDMTEARAIAEKIGRLPLIIRPAFTLGGTGGGIAYNRDEFEELAKRGMDLSPVTEILIEESLLGWKEYEMEVMRDRADNCVIICSIENFDPDGRAHRRFHHRRAHSDADGQGIPDHARPELCRDPRRGRGDRRLEHPVRRQPGQRPHGHHRDEPARQPQFGAGIQGHRLSHRQNRRQARRRLSARRNQERHHARNPGQLRADALITSSPRFRGLRSRNFAQADPTLTTQMKSVGEAMAIGRTFKESLQKCLRSLEIGRSGLGGDGKPWRIGTEVYGDRDILPRDVISRKLSVPNAERIFFIRHALRAGFTIDEIFNLTKIDRWFLVQIKEIVDFEEELARAKN